MRRTAEPVAQRSFRSRVGIAALNLIAPGLGLLRIGSFPVGFSFLLAPFALGGLITFGLGHLPITSFTAALSALAVVIALVAMLYIVPIVITWRGSKLRAPAHGLSRWYGLTAVAVAVFSLTQLMPVLMHRFYKPFYAPSQSMAPTIDKGDKFIVNMRWRGPLKRGDIVVFQALDSIRVSRVVAVAGDRIAIRGGVPILNGDAVRQQREGTLAVQDPDGPNRATLLAERLPGETSTHLLLDSGSSEIDNAPEATVPPNHFYVLGDNRDRSADSRLPPEQMGVGMVPISAIVGSPMYIHWSGNRAKIGKRLDR